MSVALSISVTRKAMVTVPMQNLSRIKWSNPLLGRICCLSDRRSWW